MVIKTKIGVYSFFPFPRPIRGQTIRMMKIFKYMSKANEIVVYCPTDASADDALIECIDDEKNITVRRFPFPLTYRKLYNDFRVYRFLEHEYRNDAFDVLQLENSPGAFFLMSKCTFPMVGVFIGRIIEEFAHYYLNQLSKGYIKKYIACRLFNLYIILCERALAHRPNYVIATSELVKEYAISLGARAQKIRILKNGVDLKEYHEYAYSTSKLELRRKLGIPQDALVFVFHGSLDFDQNIEAVGNIIKIRNKIERYNPREDFYFLVVGGPIEELRALLGTNSLERRRYRRNILFTGYVEDVKPYLFSADYGLAPFPAQVRPGGPRLKIIEFLAAGLPVITTNTGISGFEEFIESQPVYLLEENFKNLQKLIRGIGQAEVDYKKLEEFDWPRIAARNEEILKRTIE